MTGLFAAAEIIIDEVKNHRDNSPLRLPLGKYSVDTAIDKYDQTLKLFKKNYDISASADQPEK